MKGTITWYSSTTPPPIGEDEFCKTYNWSDKIILTNSQGNLGIGMYIIGADMYSHNAGNWKPTHWAFINYPDK